MATASLTWTFDAVVGKDAGLSQDVGTASFSLSSLTLIMSVEV